MYVFEFIKGNVPVEEFSDEYQRKWKEERDIEDTLLQDDAALSEVLSSIFCIVDQYDPDEDRGDNEYDEDTLRYGIHALLEWYVAVQNGRTTEEIIEPIKSTIKYNEEKSKPI